MSCISRVSSPGNHQSVRFRYSRQFFRREILIWLLTAGFLVLQVNAATLRVSSGTSGAVQDGRTWASAFRSIPSALTVARAGDELWVASGTYTNSITIPAGVSVLGGFRGDETARDARKPLELAAIFSIRGPGMITFATGTGLSVLDGFDIRSPFMVSATGARTELRNVSWLSSEAVSSPITWSNMMMFRNSTVTFSNVAVVAGPAVFFDLLSESQRHVPLIGMSNCLYRIEKCVFSTISEFRSVMQISGGAGGQIVGNRWIGHRLGTGIQGTVLICSNTSPVIEGNWFADNRSFLPTDPVPSVIALSGNSAPTIRNNLFTDLAGEAVNCGASARAVLLHNTFISRRGFVLKTTSNRSFLFCNLFVRPDRSVADAAISGPATADLVSGNCFSGFSNVVSGGLLVPTAANPNQNIPWPFEGEPGRGYAALNTNSPAVNSATARSDSGTVDMAGNPRLQEQRVDAGAFETGARSLMPVRGVIHLKPDGDDTAAGTNWASAKATIGAAIRAAIFRDCDIWVSRGEWSGGFYLPYGIDLIGGFEGTEGEAGAALPYRSRTYFSGNTRTRIMEHFVGPAAALTGLPVQRVAGIVFRNGFSDEGDGGAVRCGLLRFEGCRFEDSVARWAPVSGVQSFPPNIGGGAVSARGFVEIERCVFLGNRLQEPLATNRARIFLSGGALYASAGAAVRNSLFEGNQILPRSTESSFAPPIVGGAAVYLIPSVIRSEFRHCTFTGNLVPGVVAPVAAIRTPSGAPVNPGWAVYDSVFAADHAPIDAGTPSRYVPGDGASPSTEVQDVRDPDDVFDRPPRYPRLRAGSRLIQNDIGELTDVVDLDGIPRPRFGRDPGAFEWRTNVVEVEEPAPQVVRVSQDGNDLADGASWETAVRTLDRAAELVRSGGEIWLKAGFHARTNGLVISDGVSVMGGFAGDETNSAARDWNRNQTVIGARTAPATPGFPLISLAGYKRASRLSGLVFSNAFGLGAGSVHVLAGPVEINFSRFYNSRGRVALSGQPAAGAILVKGNGNLVRVANSLFVSNSVSGPGNPEVSASAILCFADGSLGSGARLQAINNTFVSNRTDAVGSVRQTLAPVGRSGVQVINNFFSGNDSSTTFGLAGVLYRSNLVWQSGTPPAAAGVITNDPHVITGDGLWFSILGSPAANTGDATYVTDLTDLGGGPRSDGGRPDVGAFELRILPAGEPGLVELQSIDTGGVATRPLTIPFTTRLASSNRIGTQILVNGLPVGSVFAAGAPATWTSERIGTYQVAVRIFTRDAYFDSAYRSINVVVPEGTLPPSVVISQMAPLSGTAPTSTFVYLALSPGIVSIRVVDNTGRTNNVALTSSPNFLATVNDPAGGSWAIEVEDRYGQFGRTNLVLSAPADRSEYLVYSKTVINGGRISDLNEAGDGVGNIRVGFKERAFLWRGGKFSWVTESELRSHSANTINEHGDIAGWVEDPDAWPTMRRPAIFTNGQVVLAGNLPGEVVAINDQGKLAINQIVPEEGIRQVVRVDAGTATVLPGLGGRRSEASGMNAQGWIVGLSEDADSLSYPVVWIGNEIRVLPGFTNGVGQALCLNDDGLIGGTVDGLGVVWTNFQARAVGSAEMRATEVLSVNKRGNLIVSLENWSFAIDRGSGLETIWSLLPDRVPFEANSGLRPFAYNARGQFLMFDQYRLLIAAPRTNAPVPAVTMIPKNGGGFDVGMEMFVHGANPSVERATNGFSWRAFSYDNSASLRPEEAASALFRIRLTNP